MGTVQVMALNPARKGNMGRLNSSQPLYVYDTLIAQPWLKGVIAQIRGEKAIPGVDAGDEKAVKKAKEGLKRQLPIRAIHYSKFRNNHRSSEDAVPESFLFQTTIDVDDVEYVDAALEKARELNCSNTIWKGKLLHLEYSARKKLHIDIRMPMGMTIEETQKAYCEAAGIPYDKSCITPERIIFITDKDSEIYRSKEWYGVLPDEEIQARREAFLKRGLTIDGKGTARYSLLAGDCKSPERLSGDFQGQVPNCKSPERLSGDFQGQYLAMVIIKFKVQILKFKVMTMFKTIDFRALTAILLFLLALLFSLPNLVIAIVLMMIISAILEMLRKLADWQPKKQKVPVRRI